MKTLLNQAMQALQAQARHAAEPRVPFDIQGVRVGSVAERHLGLLEQEPEALMQRSGSLSLMLPRGERDAWFAEVNQRLRAAGAILAWRDESFAIVDPAAPEPHRAPPLARVERASARFWGTLTFGAHANGYLADAQGRPTHLWVAQRAFDKATDPGAWDNLIGAGVPLGQSPREAVLREAWEEAGLSAEQAAGLQACAVLALARDIPEGFQQEQLHSFELCLPAGLQPVNQDGEVQRFECLAIGELVERRLWEQMTLDAALVTLEFLLRREGMS